MKIVNNNKVKFLTSEIIDGEGNVYPKGSLGHVIVKDGKKLFKLQRSDIAISGIDMYAGISDRM